MWICGRCNTQNPENGRFCTGCGQRRPDFNGQPGRRPGGKGGNWWLWLLLGLLALVCVALVLILLQNRDETPFQPEAPAAPAYTVEPAGEQPEAFSPEFGTEATVETPAPAGAPAAPTIPSAAPMPTTAPAVTPAQPAVPTTAPVQVPVTSAPAAFSGYLDDASRLESKGLGQLCRVMEDTIAYNVRTTWGAPEHLDRSYYVGFYLLKANDGSTRPGNILVLVYRNEVTISIPAEKVNKSLAYYYTLSFENVWCNEDGSLALTTPLQPERKVEANIPGHYFYYMGYKTLDDVYRYLVQPRLDRYSLSQRIEG